MIDGLRARSPQVFAALQRIPPPRVARVPFPWAILTAAGAAFFVGALLTIFFAVALRIFGAYPAGWASGLVTAASVGTAIGVASVAGGRSALFAYAGWIVVERFVTLTFQLRFCGTVFPAPSSCSFFGTLTTLFPYVLGGLLGYVVMRWLRVVDGEPNHLLEIAGALALPEALAFTFFRVLFGSPTDLEAALTQLLVALVAGVACGVLLRRRITDPARQWRLLAIVGVVVLGVWLLVALPAFAEQIGVGGRVAVGLVGIVAVIFPFVELGVAATILYMAEARRLTATAT